MDALLLVAVSGVLLLGAYFTYARWLSKRIFQLDKDAKTPAVTECDNKDFCPTAKSIIFGHHFTSIAGTGPIVGPAIAVMWGWLPAILWVVLGCIFIGAVHDLGSLVVSLRNKGRSIGDIAGDILGPRVRLLFLAILIVGLWIVLAVFSLVIASVLRLYPAAITPVLIQIPLAVGIGLFVHRHGKSIVLPSVIALGMMYASVVFGDVGFLHTINETLAAQPLWAWTLGLLGYAYVASVLPVWTLLQPRDYINALQLISCMVLIVGGLVVAALFAGPPTPESFQPKLQLVAPMIDWQPTGAPPLLPILFITIACGACSGFHCLVASGTTSKQVTRETDAKAVGYGSMLTEGFLATLVIAACAAGIGLGVTRKVSDGGFGMSRGNGSVQTWMFSTDQIPVRSAPDEAVEEFTLGVGSAWRMSGNVITGQSPVQQSFEARLLSGDERVRSYGGGSDSRSGPYVDVKVELRPGGKPSAIPLRRSSGKSVYFDLGNGRLTLEPAKFPVSMTGSGSTTTLEPQDKPTMKMSGLLAFDMQYRTWASAGSLGAKVGAFVQGAANFLTAIGIPLSIAIALMGVMVASFASTTMDTACRLQRYVIQELASTFLPRVETRSCRACAYDLRGHGASESGEVVCPECGHTNTEEELLRYDRDASRRAASGWNPFKHLGSVHGATMFAVVTAALLAFIPAPGQAFSLASAGTGGLILWPLFGATNQLLAGFAFVVIAAWLISKNKPIWFLVLPAIIMLVVPAWAMSWQAFVGNTENASWWSQGNWVLVGVAIVTLLLEAWLLVEVYVRWVGRKRSRFG